MPAESLGQKRLRGCSGFMRQQLRFNAVYSRRLLQGFDHVGQQSAFDFLAIRAVIARADEQIADHALAALVDKERITEDFAAGDGRVTGQEFCVHVTEDHFRRTAVVPAQQLSPCADFVLEQRTQVGGSEMPEIEYFHRSSREDARALPFSATATTE